METDYAATRAHLIKAAQTLVAETQEHDQLRRAIGLVMEAVVRTEAADRPSNVVRFPKPPAEIPAGPASQHELRKRPCSARSTES